MKYEKVIFDVDGTLWDACGTSAKGINNALEKLGIAKRFTAEDIQKYSGEPCTQIFHTLFGALENEYPNLLEAADAGERDAILSDGGMIYPNVKEGLLKLSNNAQLYLVSNCQDWYLEYFIDFADIRSILSGYNSFGASGIPKHEMITQLLGDTDPRHAVYIGDTSRDLLAAQTAGVDFIGASYGFGNVSEADQVCESFSKIAECLWLS